MSPVRDLHEGLLACLDDRDASRAVALALRQADLGTSVEEIVAVLTGVQREVGLRWQRNAWSVADEHAATAIIDRVEAAVAATIDQPAVLPTIVVVCAEDEWHTMAPRMVADALRSRAWDARFLGGSVPAEPLRQHLAAEAPLALALNCTIATSLPGAMRSILAAHDVGVPVLAGGMAFGDGPARALALGADGWAPDAVAAEAVLQEWSLRGWAPGPGPVASAAHRQLHHRRAALVARAAEALARRAAPVTAAGQAESRQVLEDLASHLEAAVLTADPTVVTEHLTWAADVRSCRHLPTDLLDAAVDALVAALVAEGLREAAATLSTCADR